MRRKYHNEIIKQRRKEIKARPSIIARKVGISRQHYYRIEDYTDVKTETLLAVCDALGLSLRDVLTDEETQKYLAVSAHLA